MNKSYTISTPEGDLCFTLETLKAIQQKLLEALKKKKERKDFAYLAREIEAGNAAPMIFEDRASIGIWRLRYDNNRLKLRRQHPVKPRPEPYTRPIHIASLEWQDEQWQVTAIHYMPIRAHMIDEGR